MIICIPFQIVSIIVSALGLIALGICILFSDSFNNRECFGIDSSRYRLHYDDYRVPQGSWSECKVSKIIFFIVSFIDL